MNIKWILFLCFFCSQMNGQIRLIERHKANLMHERFWDCAKVMNQKLDSAFLLFFKEEIIKAGGVDSFKFECEIDVMANYDLKQARVYRIKTNSNDLSLARKKYDWESYVLFHIPMDYCFFIDVYDNCIIEKKESTKNKSITNNNETDEIDITIPNEKQGKVEDSTDFVAIPNVSFYTISIKNKPDKK